jgi:hypothetical protein
MSSILTVAGEPIGDKILSPIRYSVLRTSSSTDITSLKFHPNQGSLPDGPTETPSFR